jgi:hypothetical protein
MKNDEWSKITFRQCFWMTKTRQRARQYGILRRSYQKED